MSHFFLFLYHTAKLFVNSFIIVLRVCLCVCLCYRGLSHSHRKLYDGSGGGKLSPVPSTAATSPPDEIPPTSSTDVSSTPQQRRPSGTGNVHRWRIPLFSCVCAVLCVFSLQN